MLMRDSGALPKGTPGLIAGLLSCRSANREVDEAVQRNRGAIARSARVAPSSGASTMSIPLKPRNSEGLTAALAARTRERDAALARVRQLEDEVHRLTLAQGHAVPRVSKKLKRERRKAKQAAKRRAEDAGLDAGGVDAAVQQATSAP